MNNQNNNAEKITEWDEIDTEEVSKFTNTTFISGMNSSTVWPSCAPMPTDRHRKGDDWTTSKDGERTRRVSDRYGLGFNRLLLVLILVLGALGVYDINYISEWPMEKQMAFFDDLPLYIVIGMAVGFFITRR